MQCAEDLVWGTAGRERNNIGTSDRRGGGIGCMWWMRRWHRPQLAKEDLLRGHKWSLRKTLNCLFWGKRFCPIQFWGVGGFKTCWDLGGLEEWPHVSRICQKPKAEKQIGWEVQSKFDFFLLDLGEVSDPKDPFTPQPIVNGTGQIGLNWSRLVNLAKDWPRLGCWATLT